MTSPARPAADTLGDADLAAVGSVLADPARAKVLLALADGRALPAGMLAAEAGVAASTASHHLARLSAAGLVEVSTRGRYRYYALAGPQVAALIEAVARLAPPQPVTSLRQGTRAHAMRYARRCYDHLAGRVGVALADALDTGGVVVGAGDTRTVSKAGAQYLLSIGVGARPGDTVRCCVDWTEQRHHLAGPLGRALLEHMIGDDWLTTSRGHRAVRLTPRGRSRLADLGVAVPAP